MTDSDDPTRTDVSPTDRSASKHDDETGGTEETTESDRSARSRRSDQEHLQGIDDGCGCAEVWEHLSEQRERNRERVAPATGEN